MKSIPELISVLNYRGYLRFIPDKIWLSYMYRRIFGRPINWDNPKAFSEKLQWMKLNYRNPICSSMVDKIQAKDYVDKILGKGYTIPTLGMWEKFDDINWDSLPDQFVLKCNHDSGGLVICRDKSKLDKNAAKKKIEKCLRTNYFWHGREWVYKSIKPRILAEKYMEDGENSDLNNYKIFCFNGKARYLYVSRGAGKDLKISFFDTDFAELPFKAKKYAKLEVKPKAPYHLNEMIRIAERLSSGFPFVRVDLYEIDKKIYFSELTFVPTSGWMAYEPEEVDYQLGSWLELPDMN